MKKNRILPACILLLFLAPVLRAEPVKVLFLKGPWDNLYRIEEIPGIQVTTLCFGIRGADQAYLEPAFPDSLADFKYIIAGSVRMDCLTARQRLLLKNFVSQGGGIIFFGGYFSYGRGKIRSTFLEEMMPVVLASTNFDFFPLDRKEITPGSGHAFDDIDWTGKPVCLWAHKLTPGNGTQVLLRAGDIPLLVLGSYGKGKVAAFTGTDLGSPGDKEIPFWLWRQWPKLFTEILKNIS